MLEALTSRVGKPIKQGFKHMNRVIQASNREPYQKAFETVGDQTTAISEYRYTTGNKALISYTPCKCQGVDANE